MRVPCLILMIVSGWSTPRASASVVVVTPVSPLLAAAGQHDLTFELQDVDFNGDGVPEFQVLGTPGSVELFISPGARIFVASSPPPNIGGFVTNLEAGVILGGESGTPAYQWYGGGPHSIHDLYPTVLDKRVTLVVTGTAGSESRFLGLSGYFGIEFQLASGTHYGWVRVSESESYGVGGLVTAWGYEISAGVPVAMGVPEPAVVALLGVGTVCLPFSRRRHEGC